jgi:hypothetical protein
MHVLGLVPNFQYECGVGDETFARANMELEKVIKLTLKLVPSGKLDWSLKIVI